MTTIRMRGTCGEIIQGYYLGQECLISCPIDMFTTVKVIPGNGKRSNLGYKSIKVLELMVKNGIIEKDMADAIDISLETELPTGKGYASSTADISAVAAAVAAHYAISLEGDELAKLCAAIEPTDGIMYPELTLFNHLSGERLKSYNWCPELDILILETDDEVDTVEIRKTGLYDRTRPAKSDEPLKLFEQAVSEKSLSLLGRAMELSALENQAVLHKPYLEDIMRVVRENGAVGVNTAHSGSTIGIFYEGSRVDGNGLLKVLEESGLLTPYHCVRKGRMSAGTFEIIET